VFDESTTQDDADELGLKGEKRGSSRVGKERDKWDADEDIELF
jgi:hypothetical protein